MNPADLPANLAEGDPVEVVDRHGDAWPGYWRKATAWGPTWRRRPDGATWTDLPWSAVREVRRPAPGYAPDPWDDVATRTDPDPNTSRGDAAENGDPNR